MEAMEICLIHLQNLGCLVGEFSATEFTKDSAPKTDWGKRDIHLPCDSFSPEAWFTPGIQ